jgi:hypothetical protein
MPTESTNHTIKEHAKEREREREREKGWVSLLLFSYSFEVGL